VSSLRSDLAVIASHVAQGARVLDVGCGDGALMAALRDSRGCDARGLEIDAGNVAAAVARGLSVIQGDADVDLAGYPDRSFDYAILSQTLQTARAPDVVLDHLLRIGQRAFVSFPNFAQWRVRLSLLWGGRMPVTPQLPERTPGRSGGRVVPVRRPAAQFGGGQPARPARRFPAAALMRQRSVTGHVGKSTGTKRLNLYLGKPSRDIT
jgi:methionine biosynthesis protein MetW